MTRDGRLPSPEAPWEWDCRRVEIDRPTEAVLLEWEDDEGIGTGFELLLA